MPAPSPACSVVIPWHRNLDDLRQAVDSVMAQSVQDFEIVVVANGIDDATWRQVEGLAADDARYRPVRLDIANAAIARNHGLDLARGTLVFFLDGDDLFFSGKLAHFLNAHRETGFDVAISRGVRDRGGEVSWLFPIGHWDGRQPLSEFFFCDGCNISSSAIVMARSARDRLRFNEKYVSYEDPELVIRAEAMGMRVVMLPEALYQWSDSRIANRLSQAHNYDDRLAFIDELGEAATPRARAAFRVRCVAQHAFPRDFLRNLGFFAEAIRLGAVTRREIALFMLRGLLPDGIRRSLLNFYFRSKERAVASAGPERI